ncbi:MAG: bile acid:sodium symporter family protein [Bacteroidales bacterium]
MSVILRIVNHRDFVLILALVVGLLLGERTEPLAEISMWTLGLVMVFATTGFSFKSWVRFSNALRPLAWSALLNFGLFGLVVIGMAWIFFHDANFSFYIGFVLVVAAPPGPSVIPFSALLGGDNNFSVTGVFGLHLLAMLLTPMILLLLLGHAMVNPLVILQIMAQLILIPLLISRILRHPKILPRVEKVRSTIIKWGFFLVIAPIVGMSAPVFLNEPVSVLKISGVLFMAMFVMGLVYHVVMHRLGKPRGFIISSTLMMVIKSSAFAAVTAFTFFRGDARVALPPAVVSVFVTLFIVFYSLFVRRMDRSGRGSS